MKNSEIIAAAKVLNGITEEAHTFSMWKSMGYRVNKGEHAAFKARIWKFYKKDVEVQNKQGETETVETNNAFMKTASFFTKSQVSLA